MEKEQNEGKKGVLIVNISVLRRGRYIISEGGGEIWFLPDKYTIDLKKRAACLEQIFRFLA